MSKSEIVKDIVNGRVDFYIEALVKYFDAPPDDMHVVVCREQLTAKWTEEYEKWELSELIFYQEQAKCDWNQSYEKEFPKLAAQHLPDSEAKMDQLFDTCQAQAAAFYATEVGQKKIALDKACKRWTQAAVQLLSRAFPREDNKDTA